jgi:hypothetical protein
MGEVLQVQLNVDTHVLRQLLELAGSIWSENEVVSRHEKAWNKRSTS